MKGAATFVYRDGGDNSGRRVSLFQQPRSKLWTITVEGFPSLTNTRHSASRAVESFAGWREMSLKDWGASEVDWGEYSHLAEHWPVYAHPWNEPI